MTWAAICEEKPFGHGMSHGPNESGGGADETQ